MVDYINYLDKNDTAYTEYLTWRLDDPEKSYGYNMAMGDCELCLKLRSKKGYKYANGVSELPTSKTVMSLDEWLYSEEDEECLL